MSPKLLPCRTCAVRPNLLVIGVGFKDSDEVFKVKCPRCQQLIGNAPNEYWYEQKAIDAWNAAQTVSNQEVA